MTPKHLAAAIQRWVLEGLEEYRMQTALRYDDEQRVNTANGAAEARSVAIERFQEGPFEEPRFSYFYKHGGPFDSVVSIVCTDRLTNESQEFKYPDQLAEIGEWERERTVYPGDRS